MLQSPRGDQTRPTLGRVRESLFSILGPSVIDARTADLCAGAGGLGLEALSRGAKSCVFVERARPALDALRANIAKLRYDDRSRVAAQELEKWLRSRPLAGEPLDLIFLDPPYGSPDLPALVTLIGEALPLSPEALVVVQCSPRDELLERQGLLSCHRHQVYGETALHFFLPLATPP